MGKLNQTLVDDTKRPFQDILITHTVVLNDPFPDLDGVIIPPSPPPPDSVFDTKYVAADEETDETKGKSIEELEELLATKEAEARATILEIVGDLPSADMAPPENVLFVCKLNPVTTSEDLEVIFSRFGKVNCAEVIRDYVTGNSLQYAFVEFADKQHCEDAYFKMDNVLIDERRIHVDFSQSVSKYKWRGKGRGVEQYDSKGRVVPLETRTPSGTAITRKPVKIDNSKSSDPLYKLAQERKKMEEDKMRRKEEKERKRNRKSESSESADGDREKMIKLLKKQLKKKKKDKKKKSKKKRSRSSSSSD